MAFSYLTEIAARLAVSGFPCLPLSSFFMESHLVATKSFGGCQSDMDSLLRLHPSMYLFPPVCK